MSGATRGKLSQQKILCILGCMGYLLFLHTERLVRDCIRTGIPGTHCLLQGTAG